MAFFTIKAECESRLARLTEELDDHIERAVNYKDMVCEFDDEDEKEKKKENVVFGELVWNDASDQRKAETLKDRIRVYEKIIAAYDEILSLGEDKKRRQRLQKEIETLISSVRRIQRESEAVIEREREIIDEAQTALEFIDAMRKG